jgi:membrane fusion protein, macrolide-specific efflux system
LKNKKVLISILIILLIVSGFFIYRYFGPQETVKPKVGDVVESIYGLGTVSSDKVYHLRSGLTQYVRKFFVNEGDLVQPGQSLAQLEDIVMRSPIEGTVTAVSYRDGEIVPPQVSIVTVTNLDKLYLEVSLEQQSILRVKKDQAVAVSFESLRNEKYEGVVASIYPRDSQFIVRIELKKWPREILPGMTADVAILVGKKTNVLLIPLRTIVSGQVTRIRDNKKERVPVKLGVIDGEWGEITSENILPDDELVARK